MRTQINGGGTFTASHTPASGTDVSGLTGDWAVVIKVSELKATSGGGLKAATLQVQYVTAADFTSPQSGPVFRFEGAIQKGAPVIRSIRRADFPGLPVGLPNGKLRLCVLDIDDNASVTCGAWVES